MGGTWWHWWCSWELAEACVCPESSPPRVTPAWPPARCTLVAPCALGPVSSLCRGSPARSSAPTRLVVSPGRCLRSSGSPGWKRKDLPGLVLGIGTGAACRSPSSPGPVGAAQTQDKGWGAAAVGFWWCCSWSHVSGAVHGGRGHPTPAGKPGRRADTCPCLCR